MTHAEPPMFLLSRGWGWSVVAGLAGAVLLALLARAVIDHPVHYDELLHILSARGLLQTGQLVVADGLYTRAELYTRAVAWSFRHFGDSPVSARLPALAAGMVLVFVIGAWVVRRAGLLAGFTTSVLLCVVPTTVDVAVFARFYTVHALLMAVMFIVVFEALEPARTGRERLAALVAVGALVALGWHFQETTVIAAGATLAAVLTLVAFDNWAPAKAFVLRRPFVVATVFGVGVTVALTTVWYVGLLDQFGHSALWALRNANRYHYYVVAFRNDLPLLWPLLPLAATAAVIRPEQRRLGVFCSVLVASAFLVHSFAAQKLMRYAYYLVPMMCVLGAVAIAGAVKSAGRFSPAVVSALIVATFLLSQEGARAVNLLAGRVPSPANRPFGMEPDWSTIVAELAPRAHAAGQVVTSNSMKALYYLGRYDYELNATIVPETDSETEFGVDLRTGRRVISRAESIARVLSTPGTTLVVIEESKIGLSSGVTAEAFAEIQSRCSELTLVAAGSGVRAWSCANPS